LRRICRLPAITILNCLRSWTRHSHRRDLTNLHHRAMILPKPLSLALLAIVFLAPPATAGDLAELRADGFRVHVGPTGGLHLDVGGESWLEESSYSFPGDTIGLNWLSAQERGHEPTWKAVVVQAVKAITIHAHGSHYSLERRVELRASHVVITDIL